MDRSDFLQTVYDRFKTDAQWPTVRELQIQFRSAGSVRKLAAEIGENIIVCEEGAQGVCFLKLEGIASCSGSETDVNNFLSLIRLLVARSIRSGSKTVTSEEIRTELSLSDQEIRRLSELIKREAGIWSGAGWSADQPAQFHLEPGESAAFFETVNSLEEFRAIQHRVWKDERDTAALRFGGRSEIFDDILSETRRAEPDRRSVFVIHGRDEKLRRAMFEFLRALDLKPLEWSELLALTREGSPYIGNIIENGFMHVAAVVALLTPDDVVFLRPDLWSETDGEPERVPTGQARPNVLFELGLAFAHHPERTVIVEIGTLRPFTDVSGRHVVHFDGSAYSRTDLKNRLRSFGCQLNDLRTDWLTVGDFGLAGGPGFQLDVEHASIKVMRTAADPALKLEACRKIYGLAISILRELHGEFYGGSESLPGYLWVAERSDWFKVSQRLGSINGATGRFQPHTEPSQFDPADETKLESATEILRLYLWSAANLVKFEDVRRIYSLPKPDRVAETLTEADLASE